MQKKRPAPKSGPRLGMANGGNYFSGLIFVTATNEDAVGDAENREPAEPAEDHGRDGEPVGKTLDDFGEHHRRKSSLRSARTCKI